MKEIKCWVDSHANIHSCKKFTFEIEEEEWNRMTEKEKEELIYEQVCNYLDWGWEEECE